MAIPNICVIPMENKPFAVPSATWPKLSALIQTGSTALYTWHIDFFDVASPSGPNYQAFTFGTQAGDAQYFADDAFHSITLTSIYDALNTASIKFSAFAEALTSGGIQSSGNVNYAQRHFPISYCSHFNATSGFYGPDAHGNKIRGAGSVGTAFGTSGSDTNFASSSTFSAALADMNSASPSSFYFLGPCLANQTHGSPGAVGGPWANSASGSGGGIPTGDAFLAYMIGQIQTTSWYTAGHGNIIIWFDEGNHSGTTGEMTNLVLINEGPAKGHGAVGSAAATLNHRGLLFDITNAYGVPALGHATVKQAGSIGAFLDLRGGGGGGPGTPSQVAFGQSPTNAVQNISIAPPITVLIEDVNGLVTTSTANVTLAIGTNPAAGTLAGTTTVAAVNGTATFSGLSINNAGTGYTLVATSAGLTSATSPAFNITATVATATQLLIAQQPTNAQVNTSLFPAITVKICDASGVQTTSTANVVVAIGTNPSSGTLGGTLTKAAVSGLATFSNLTLDTAGVGYTLTFTSAGLTSATSSAFTINAAAATRDPLKQAFLPTSIWNQPIGSGAVFVPANILPCTIRDMTSDETVVVMSPTSPATAINQSTALWTGRSRCFGQPDDTGVVLTTVPIPASFTVPGTIGGNFGLACVAADKHTLIQGEPFARCVASTRGTLGFLYGNTVEDLYNDGRLGGKGGSGLSDLGGVLRLGELVPGGKIPHALAINIDESSNSTNTFRWPATRKDGYSYSGTNSKLVPGALVALLPSFNVAGLTSPAGRILGAAFQNYGAYIVNDCKRSVRTICTEHGPNGNMIDEFLTVWGIPFQTAGVGAADPWSTDIRAIFNALQIVDNNAANAIGGGGSVNPALVALPLTSLGGGPGPPASVAFQQGPTGAAPGATISPPVTVQILDSNGQQTTSNAGVSVVIGTNPPPGTGVLSGGGSVAAVSGLATFSGLSVNTANTSGAYTLVASSPSLGFTGSPSSGFQVGALVGLPDHLGISAVTGTTAGATMPTVTVQILDKGGNQTTSTASIVIAIAANPPPGGTLSGTLTATVANGKVVSGLASFTDLSINVANASGGYTLIATCPSLGITPATSNAFNITGGGGSGTPTQLLFVQQPPATIGSNTPFTVTVQTADAQNAPTPTIANIHCDLATPNNGTLSGMKVATSSGTGLATFTGLSVDNPAANYRLVATCTNPALSFATSNFFTITNTADLFTVLPNTQPVVTGISPSTGPQTGGTMVTITGSGFTGANEVDFGLTSANSVVVVNDTTITCLSPVGPTLTPVTFDTIGGTYATSTYGDVPYSDDVDATIVPNATVDVVVTTPSGISVATSADQFTYSPFPMVGGVTPNTVTFGAVQLVTVTGSALASATAVQLGATALAFTVLNDTAITATVPSTIPLGVYDITVTTPSGTSAITTVDQITIVPPALASDGRHRLWRNFRHKY